MNDNFKAALAFIKPIAYSKIEESFEEKVNRENDGKEAPAKVSKTKAGLIAALLAILISYFANDGIVKDILLEVTTESNIEMVIDKVKQD